MKNPTRSHPAPRRRTAGFTLMELMVSVALGLIVMAGLVAVYVNISRTNSEMSRTHGIIENGRFSIDILQEDLEHAGYWAGYVPPWDDLSRNQVAHCFATPPVTSAVAVGDSITGNTSGATATVAEVSVSSGHIDFIAVSSISGTFTTTEMISKSGTNIGTATLNLNPSPCVTTITPPDPCLQYSSTNWTSTYTYAFVSVPVQTYQSVPASCSTLILNQQANTDILVVRHAETCVPGSGNCDAYSSSKVYFQPTFCSTELKTATPSYFIGTGTFALTKRDCTTAAEYRKVVSDIYYVRTYSSSTTDGIPTLVRIRLDGIGSSSFVTEPLIEGVESFVAELGVDSKPRSVCSTSTSYSALPYRVKPSDCTYDASTATNNTMANNRGDGVPDSYVRCATSGCDFATLRDVVAVKVFVLARSTDAGASGTDSRTYSLGGAAGSYSVDSTGTKSAGTSTYTLTAGGDKFRRHVFQTTVRMNNVSGRREAPAT